MTAVTKVQDRTKTGSWCELGNNDGWRVNAAKAVLLSGVDKISSLKEEQKTTVSAGKHTQCKAARQPLGNIHQPTNQPTNQLTNQDAAFGCCHTDVTVDTEHIMASKISSRLLYQGGYKHA